jgi:hypothetical protein
MTEFFGGGKKAKARAGSRSFTAFRMTNSGVGSSFLFDKLRVRMTEFG